MYGVISILKHVKNGGVACVPKWEFSQSYLIMSVETSIHF